MKMRRCAVPTLNRLILLSPFGDSVFSSNLKPFFFVSDGSRCSSVSFVTVSVPRSCKYTRAWRHVQSASSRQCEQPQYISSNKTYEKRPFYWRHTTDIHVHVRKCTHEYKLHPEGENENWSVTLTTENGKTPSEKQGLICSLICKSDAVWFRPSERELCAWKVHMYTLHGHIYRLFEIKESWWVLCFSKHQNCVN